MQEIIVPKISKESEKFDLDSFDLKKENLFIKEDDYYIKKMTQSFGYAEHWILENSFFSIVKLYHKNTFIKEKGISFNNGSEYGIWYKFDEEGHLIEELDTDKGYDYDWEDIIDYCEDQKIPLTKGYTRNGFKTTVYKEENDKGTKIWIITYQISGDQLMEVTLDGSSGEELNRKELGFINP